MNYKYIFLSLAIALLLSSSYQEAQAAAGETTKQTEQQQQEEDARNVLIACVILTKHRMYDYQKTVFDMMAAHSNKESEQSAFYRKVFSTLLETCYSHITLEQAQSFLSQLQNQNFDPSPYFTLYQSFNLENFQSKDGKQIDTKLTQTQEYLQNYAEDFEKAMNDKREEEEDYNRFNKKRDAADLEPRIMGFSMGQLSKKAKIGYLVGAFAVIFGLIAFGLNYVFAEDKNQLKKNKKAKKN